MTEFNDQQNTDLSDEVDTAEATASISIETPQEVTDNDDLVKHVPEVAAVPSDTDRENWLKGTVALGEESIKAGARGRVASSIQLAMAVLLYWFARNPKFTEELTVANFRLPTGKKEFAGAASYIYGLNTADNSNKNAIGKRVERLCSQYEGLQRELGERGLRREDFAFDCISVRRIASIITVAGGTDALLRAPELDNDDNPKLIALSAQKQVEILYERGVETFSDRGRPSFRLPLEVVRPDGSVERVGGAPDTFIRTVIADMAPTLPRTLALADLLMMGGCVLPEQSLLVKVPGSDPNDPNTEMRTDERQVVFHKDGKATQSLLLAPSSVVVETRTHVPDIILGGSVQGHTRFYTEKRKRVEENLKDDRRRVFDVGVVGTDKETGVGRLMVFTDAASDEEGRASVGVLLQRLDGPIPFDVDPQTLAPLAECKIASSVFRADAVSYAANSEKFVRRQGKKVGGKAVVKPEVDIFIDGKGLTFESPADAKPVTVPATLIKEAGSITVRLDDLVAFFQTYVRVHTEVTSDVGCWMGEAVMCFEFSTHSATHRVFIPNSIGGTRSPRSIVRIKNQIWPVGGLLKPNNFD